VKTAGRVATSDDLDPGGGGGKKKAHRGGRGKEKGQKFLIGFSV